MFLFIDTTEDEIILALFEKDKLINQISEKARYRQSELLLIRIDAFLRKSKGSLDSLKGIIVAKGPGSFTGTRIGVTTANALAFALDIPILGIKKENLGFQKLIKKYRSKIRDKEPILPIYSKPPNITIKKKK